MSLPPGNNFTIQDLNNLPEDTPAELIDGQYYRQASPSHKHQRILYDLFAAIEYYITANNKTCRAGHAPFPVRLDLDDRTLVKPDIFVALDPNKVSVHMCNGCPDWIIEIISPSTSSHDYVTKLDKYRRAGLREYWIINARLKTVLTYYFDASEHVKQYIFKEKIPVHIFNNLVIDSAWFEN